MSETRTDQRDRINRYARMIEKQTGRAIRPYREDGYVNVLNKYGTRKDPQENYHFQAEPSVSDEELTRFYEGNGLFARIIDAPAEEAIRHGFEIEGIDSPEITDFINSALDELDWEETAMTAIKWCRLFGGSIAVLLVDDGRGLEEPLDWKNIKSIDDIRIYDRSVVIPDYASMFSYDPSDPFRTRGSRLGMPEFYQVSSRFGNFTVHDSRCLVFQNGVLPENCSDSQYQLWGIPEYIRINRAIRDAELAHGTAPKMLDRSVQAIYKMKDLASVLATEEGEEAVIKRLQTIDMARGLLNSITIDSEGEEYDFRQFSFSGVSEVIDSTCNYLSALTNIPQSVLFGRAPAGMDATGHSDMENYYNFVERIQKRILRSNLRYLISAICQAGLHTGEIDEAPKINVKFNPLWSLSEEQQVALEQQRASAQLTRAQVANAYVQMQALDPSEVRKKLADGDEFDVETMLDDYDDESLFPDGMPEFGEGQEQQGGNEPPGGGGGGMPISAPEVSPEEEANPDNTPQHAEQKRAKLVTNSVQQDSDKESSNYTAKRRKTDSVGIYVIKDGQVLTGVRSRYSKDGANMICGPGGHVEEGETHEEAAIRETEEEFGITPKELIPFGIGEEEDNGLQPMLFLCTAYDGIIKTDNEEIFDAKFYSLDELDRIKVALFKPFYSGLKRLIYSITSTERSDEEPASWITVNGNHIPLDESGEAKSENISDPERNHAKKRLTLRENLAKIKSLLTHKDTDIPDDKVEFATGENGKVFAFDPETHETSGLGPIDSDSNEKKRRLSKGKIAKKLTGTKASDGIEIKGVSFHAAQRAAERHVNASGIKKALSQQPINGKDGKSKVYSDGRTKVVVSDDGIVVTVIYLGKKKGGN